MGGARGRAARPLSTANAAQGGGRPAEEGPPRGRGESHWSHLGGPAARRRRKGRPGASHVRWQP
eukprot:11871213-Alexandrium_andersonii.AAC.1